LSNFVWLTDINECEEGISGCSQLCNNTVGGYFCSCMAGYSLLEDGRNCIGRLPCFPFYYDCMMSYITCFWKLKWHLY